MVLEEIHLQEMWRTDAQMDGWTDGQWRDFGTKLIYPFFLKKKAGVIKNCLIEILYFWVLRKYVLVENKKINSCTPAMTIAEALSLTFIQPSVCVYVFLC